MLDTNTASYLISGKPPVVRRRARRLAMGKLCVSAITEAELRYGVVRLGAPAKLSGKVSAFLSAVEILPWNSAAAQWYARLRHELAQAGPPLGTYDLLIAAHALATGVVLVTNDQSFGHVGRRLRRENWVSSESLHRK